MAETLRLVIDAYGAVRDAAVDCETEVFLDRYGVEPAQMRRDYDPYDPATVWVVLTDSRDRVVAGTRLLRPGVGSLKSLDDVGRPPWSLNPTTVAAAAGLDPAATWDFATLFRRRGQPGPPVTAALCYGIMVTMRENGGRYAVAVLDRTVRLLLDRLFGLRFHMMPGATRKMFMNSLNDPVFVSVTDLLARARRVNPEGYRMFALGMGLDDISLPPPGAFSLPEITIDLREGFGFAAPRTALLPSQRAEAS